MGWIVSPVRRGCSTSRFRGSFVVLLAIHGPSPCDVFDTYQTRLQFQPPRDVGKVALPHPRPKHPGTVAADRLRIRSGAVLCAPRLSASITYGILVVDDDTRRRRSLVIQSSTTWM